MRRGPARLAAIATALALAAAAVASCATGGGLSIAQRAYNTCTDDHNEKRAGLDLYWAFAAGVDSSTSTCYWQWGAETVDAAVNGAMAGCREEYEDCYLYSSSAGNSDWVQQISNNGGTDGSGDGGGGLSFSDFVEWGTFALSLGTMGVQTYDAIENGGGGGDSGGYSTPAAGYNGGGTDCTPLWEVYQECMRRKENMKCLPGTSCPTGTDTWGQHEAFNECEASHLGAYNACMASQ